MTTISRPYQKTPVPPQVAVAVIGGVTLFLILVIIWVLGYQLVYAGRIFPGVSVSGVDLSGMKPVEAAVKLNQALSYPNQGKVLLRYGQNSWVASPAELGMVFDPSTSAMTVFLFSGSSAVVMYPFGLFRRTYLGRSVFIRCPP